MLKTKFYLNKELQKAFEDVKQVIVEVICEGVEIFELGRREALRIDYLKTRIG